MRRGVRESVALLVGAGLAVTPLTAQAAGPAFTAGAAGVGDPYFPLDGNGGYDALHYDLDLQYDPPSDRLTGVATIEARATQNLSSFHLDLDGLTVRSITVDGRPARWSRQGQELVVVPARRLPRRGGFTTVVRYDGVPQTIEDELGISGFLHTDDGAIVAGQPHVAATWFPVNDHPSDTASYTVHVTAPSAVDVVSNGVLTQTRRQGRLTRWTWDAREPMASYLVTLAIGDYDVDAYRADGLRYWDAIDVDLFTPFAAPPTGTRFAFSQKADSSFKRLSRRIDVPAGGASVSFTVARATEQDWDYVFVEARTVGRDDWTTLPDTNGHSAQDTGQSCPSGWHAIHPFLEHYQSVAADGTCRPTGSTGAWWAATGEGAGNEEWNVDLSPYAGAQVELSISYASDDVFQTEGVAVDDVVVSTGIGSTSFEEDGDTLDGWTVPGAPDGSPGNENDWESSTADSIVTAGEVAQASLARQPEIIAFLASTFGRYPFRAAGGIVSDDERLGFALETQTRPVYAPVFFTDSVSGDSVVVHELAHQWFGDDLALKRWKHIWLNEGFATYAEWLWSGREGLGTPQEIFDSFAAIPADEAGFWGVSIGDPGPDKLFDGAVYNRGAMTLHALRQEIGDGVFLRLLRQWAARNSGESVTTARFVALAERLSGKDLDAFFETWLFTPQKPAGIEPAPALAARVAADPPSVVDARTRFGDRRSAR